ncbi:hypothetical protein J2Z75_000602 [Rhizobium herbae]|uniref:Uncharacterized protein n=1 Tax=Rhizobium herbae TaxID=508661 RepID=A0ABS4EGQ8_9HYPH|nr:hypothetical protein [Rhizobium herbae]
MEPKKRVATGIFLIALGAAILVGLVFVGDFLTKICPPFA